MSMADLTNGSGQPCNLCHKDVTVLTVAPYVTLTRKALPAYYMNVLENNFSGAFSFLGLTRLGGMFFLNFNSTHIIIKLDINH